MPMVTSKRITMFLRVSTECLLAGMCRTGVTGKPSQRPEAVAWPPSRWRSFWKNREDKLVLCHSETAKTWRNLLIAGSASGDREQQIPPFGRNDKDRSDTAGG